MHSIYMHIECFELRVSRVGVVFEVVLNLESKRRTAGSQARHDDAAQGHPPIVRQQLQGGGGEHDEMHARKVRYFEAISHRSPNYNTSNCPQSFLEIR
jgi:hypothetical protein